VTLPRSFGRALNLDGQAMDTSTVSINNRQPMNSSITRNVRMGTSVSSARNLPQQPVSGMQISVK
jgi:hypothetical protein